MIHGGFGVTPTNVLRVHQVESQSTKCTGEHPICVAELSVAWRRKGRRPRTDKVTVQTDLDQQMTDATRLATIAVATLMYITATLTAFTALAAGAWPARSSSSSGTTYSAAPLPWVSTSFAVSLSHRHRCRRRRRRG